MKIICPRCGKDNTIPFSDSVLHTTGFECQDCHQDFGVDDGKNIEDHIRYTNEFIFTHKTKDQFTYQVTILKIADKATLKMTKIYPDKKIQPYEPIDFTKEYNGFVQMLYRQLYILDWPIENSGFVTDNNEEFEITIAYTLHAFDDFKIHGINQFPIYFKVLDTIFSSLFVEEKENA